MTRGHDRPKRSVTFAEIRSTRLQSVKEAGAGPLKLGATLCLFLVAGGYGINVALARILG